MPVSPEFLTLYSFTLASCERLVADVSDDELAHQPTPGVNTPGWILAHLAISTDYALQLLGRPKQMPTAWHEAFGPGTKPPTSRDAYPAKAELLAALRRGHEAVVAALPRTSEEQLRAPNPLTALPFLVETLPTAGDLLAHLISTHEAAHLGHLSNWRRQTGRPPLF
ncbi:MAG TPA: DinB family protein [Lacipirellula sp.]